MSDSTPTEKFAVPASGGQAADGDKSKRLLIVLISIGAALLLAIIILLIVLLTRDDGDTAATPDESSSPSVSASSTPTETVASPTPTATETEEAPPAPEPEPAPASPIISFTADDTTIDCDGEPSIPVQFSWNTTGQTLWFGVGTNNAKNAPYDTFPLVHTLDFTYQCGQASGQQIYTITVEQSNGDILSKTITIKE